MRVAAHNLATARGTVLGLHEGYRTYEPVDLEPIEDPCYRRVFNPRYVQACQGGQWCLNLINRTTGIIQTVPYRCRSWRCTAKWVDHKTGKLTSCQRWKAAQNYARIREALSAYQSRDIVFAVFTYPAPKGADPQEAYDKLQEGWPSLRKRLHRLWGDFKFVATVEVTRRGWPHLNVIIAGGGLGRLCTTQVDRKGRSVYMLGVKHRAKLEAHLRDTGMGYVCTVERATSAEAISGYAVKVAGEWEAEEGAGTAAAEVVKLSQVPVNAKKGFRRLRSSRGFLPRVHTTASEWTGWLARTDNGMPVLRGPGPVAFPDYARPPEPWLQHREPITVYTLRTPRVRPYGVEDYDNPQGAHNAGQEEHPIVYTHNTDSCSSVSSPTWAGVRVSNTLDSTSAGVSFTNAANAAPASGSSILADLNRACTTSVCGSAPRCSSVNDSVSCASIVAGPRMIVGAMGSCGVNGAGCSFLGAAGITCTGPP